MPKKVIEQIDTEPVENSDIKIRRPISSAMFIIIALSVAVGYLVGVYHLQIIAAIGPVFGQKAHSGTIDLSSVQVTYNQLASRFDGKLDTDKLIQGANRGLVDAAGDDYTVYMSPDEAEEFNKSLSGNIGGGIGAEIGKRKDNVIIVRTLPDNPAIEAGLQANDIILAVNDESTKDWNVEQTVAKVRGEEGTTVKLSILRGTEIKEYTITRAIINNPSVESKIVENIGYMTIYRFDEETGDLAKVAAQSFIKEGVKGVILDLRGNGGGYVDAAKDVAGLWLSEKTVVVEKTGSRVKETVRTKSGAILANVPTVVLVDGGTASASEIVAGALQDYGAAKLVGEKTFGKGSVQLPLDLDGGALLKVTVAKWYTPKGKNINKEGIKPDTTVELTQENIDNDIDTQINAAKAVLAQ